ncbi:hypothetical protein TIFTF001_007468 [Ficus carica]|uniref:Uncharacterized protein n=1 Tax=Ficus carica TaxID=3494 RepID=A0AA88CX53_FICCA|nr:hypothetical protein TIFTF001_007468 [Ficus carica]
MELKYFGGSGKASPRRSDHQLRSFRARSQSRTSNTRSSNSLFDAIAKANGGGHVVSQTEEDGVVRMKIVVKKQDLKQMLAAMGGCNNNNINNKDDDDKKQANLPRLSVEQRLNLLRKKHLLRANLAKQNRRGSWSPVLQSIPEEL